MVAVFQLDLAILVSVMSGELRLRLLVPYTVVAIIPAMAGIIVGKYLGNVGNACVVTGVCYAGTVLLAFYVTGRLLLVPPLGVLFISAGSLVPPLVFIPGCDSGLSAPATPRLKRKSLLVGNRGGSNSEV